MKKLYKCLELALSFGLSLLLVSACAAPPIVAPPPVVPVATETTQESPPSPPASPTPLPPDSTGTTQQQGTTAATIAQDKIRPSVLAGTWYPDDPEQLRQMVDRMLAEAEMAEGTPIGLIVPHAGYVYSGAVAAAGLKQLEGKDVDVAVIISADHQEPISRPIAVYPEGGFQTPLGVVPVDADLAKALIAADPRITADTQAHTGEHMIEIELPFLQRVCPKCRIVPVLIGVDDDETVKALADALLKVLPGRRAVVIASSDLSHYPKAADAREIDSATLNAILTGDPARVRQTTTGLMSRGYANLFTCACSEAAILVTMQVAKGLGADTIPLRQQGTTVSLLRYANSADAEPSTADQAVGYGAVMLCESPLSSQGERFQPPGLTPERQKELLGLARSSIAEYLRSGSMPDYPLADTGDYRQTSDPELLRPAGAFVTLKDATHGDLQSGPQFGLRGCVGNMQADKPLYQTVQAMAVAAATADPRFPPLTADELDRAKIEISVLSPCAAWTM